MESLSKSTRFYPERQEGFTKKGYHVYDLNLDIDEGEMIALNKKAEEYETFPIFNRIRAIKFLGRAHLFFN
jgi:hypothetical protein